MDMPTLSDVLDKMHNGPDGWFKFVVKFNKDDPFNSHYWEVVAIKEVGEDVSPSDYRGHDPKSLVVVKVPSGSTSILMGTVRVRAKDMSMKDLEDIIFVAIGYALNLYRPKVEWER